MSDMREAFTKALADNPRDETTHKVYADWLEENGFDDEARVQRDWTLLDYEAAEIYFEAFSNGVVFISVPKILHAAEEFLKSGKVGTTNWTHHIYRTEGDAETFWRHYVVLTGKPVPLASRTDVPLKGCCQRYPDDYDYGFED